MRLGVAIAAAALLVGACGSTVSNARAGARVSKGDDASLGEPATGPGRATATAPANHATGKPNAPIVQPRASGPVAALSAPRANHSPIEIGLLYVVNDGAESAGVDNGNNFTVSQVVHAFVDSYNASGGIAGRRITPVYAEMHSASNSYEMQAQHACATFTEDHKVAAVISNLGYYSPSLLTCLTAAKVPVITGDWSAPDNEDARRYPLLLTPVSLTGEQRVTAVVDHLHAVGYLQPQSRIGVIIEDCPIDQRVYKNGLVPALARAGLKVTSSFAPRCFQSLQDYGGQASELQTGVLQFNRDRVDRVIVVSQAAEANIVNLFSQGADAQAYRPGYALSSVAAPAVLTLNAPPAQLANMHGVGWIPSLDSQRADQLVPSAAGRACLDVMKGRGLVASSSSDYTYVYGACDSFGLYAALLRATSGDAAPDAVTAALSGVAQQFAAASTVNGALAVRDGHIGAAAGRVFAYSSGAGFAYTTDAFAL